jgi:hypothetical protein
MRRALLLIGLLGLASPLQAQTFNAYECTQDCSGHEAGYVWAEENDIDDADDCSTASNSFDEGCQSFVEEQAAEQAEEQP